MKCKVCDNDTTLFDTALVLQKYDVRYFRCASCGFMQTEDPYWLEEAYASAITSVDIGASERNYANAAFTKMCLTVLFPQVKRGVDYGRGYGLFVRLMRDRGYDFYGYDKYCENLFSKGFDADLKESYDFLTAFEVFEHIPEPAQEMEVLTKISPNIFLSTLLLPKYPPKIKDWWYYSPRYGQHVSFHSPDSMKCLARKNGLKWSTNGSSHHLFSRTKVPNFILWIMGKNKVNKLFDLAFNKGSLLKKDADYIDGQLDLGKSKNNSGVWLGEKEKTQ